MEQSPQICLAFHCHASIRSEAGKSSVENSCDIERPRDVLLLGVRQICATNMERAAASEHVAIEIFTCGSPGAET